MPYILFLLVCFIWGASFILMKKATLAFGPITTGGWRAATAAVTLAVLWFAVERSWPITGKHFWRVLLFALVSYTWPYSIQPYLVARHGSGFIGMTVALVPLLTLLVSAPMLGVYPTLRQAIGVVGGLIFIGVLMFDGLQRQVPIGDMAMAASVPLSYALGNVYLRKHFLDLRPLALTLTAFAFSSFVLLPLGTVTERVVVSPDLPMAATSLLVLGVVGTGVATWTFNHLVHGHGALFAGMVTYLVPIGAILWGWLDHEQVTARQLVALAGIFAMVAVVQYGAAAQKPAIEEEALEVRV